MVAERPPEQGGYSLQAYIISNSQHMCISSAGGDSGKGGKGLQHDVFTFQQCMNVQENFDNNTDQLICRHTQHLLEHEE